MIAARSAWRPNDWPTKTRATAAAAGNANADIQDPAEPPIPRRSASARDDPVPMSARPRLPARTTSHVTGAASAVASSAAAANHDAPRMRARIDGAVASAPATTNSPDRATAGKKAPRTAAPRPAPTIHLRADTGGDGSTAAETLRASHGSPASRTKTGSRPSENDHMATPERP